MPNDKQQPPSIDSHIADLKRFLDPVGITSNQAAMLCNIVEALVDRITATDGRERRFLLMVLTREDNSPRPLICTDLIANVDMAVVIDTLREWLAKTDGDKA